MEIPEVWKPTKRSPFDGVPEGADFDGDLDGWCSWKTHNDLGNAERFIARHGADLMWIPGTGWLAWDGHRWSVADGPRMAQLKAQQTVKKIREEAKAAERSDETDERRNKLLKWARDSGFSAKIAAMQKEAAPHLTRQVDELDANPHLLTAANGTIELGIRINLRESRREDLMTRMSPVAFNESAGAPQFEAFLEKIMPDPELRDFLQLWFGYGLTGDVSEQVVVLLHGAGSNGKSTLLILLAHVLGDFALTLPFASLLKDDRRRGSEATPDLARLPGARMVTASEPDVGSRFSESIIKSMTGGEKMAARHLNQGFFEFTPQFKLTLSFNTKPAVRGQDEGIWRRLLMVPFSETVTKDDVGPVLAAREEEAPGILNWLLNGVERWHESGLVIPETVRAATQTYRTDYDAVGQFLEQWTRSDKDALHETVPAGKLWDAWQSWCKEAAEEPGSRTMFGRRLTDRGFHKAKAGGLIIYSGIALTKEAMDSLNRGQDSSDGSGTEDSTSD